jgi:hypothetical protein
LLFCSFSAALRIDKQTNRKSRGDNNIHHTHHTQHTTHHTHHTLAPPHHATTPHHRTTPHHHNTAYFSFITDNNNNNNNKKKKQRKQQIKRQMIGVGFISAETTQFLIESYPIAFALIDVRRRDEVAHFGLIEYSFNIPRMLSSLLQSILLFSSLLIFIRHNPYDFNNLIIP